MCGLGHLQFACQGACIAASAFSFARDAFRTASHGFLDTAHLRSLLARKKGGDAAAVKMNPLIRVHASFSCFKQAAPAEAQAILSKTQAYDFCMQLFNGALPL